MRISNPPTAEALMEGSRSIGNYDLAAALGDLIDNSITAEANTISLICDYNAKEPIVLIKDNGNGMTKDELILAMRPASTNPLDDRDEDDLGRFGWGLKSASFSQARKLTVASKKNDKICAGIWDLDDIKNFEMELLSHEDAVFHLEEFGEELKNNGTIIIWQKCDRLSDNYQIDQAEFNQKIMDASAKTSLTFHRFLDGTLNKKITLYLNGLEIKGYDPFLKNHSATQAVHSEAIDYGEFGEINITPYILPHYSKLDTQTIEQIEGQEGLVRNQGFYVYRNNRLIIHGTWFGIFKHGELSDLIRVKIDIPNTMDNIWQISIDKKDAKLPQNLKLRLKKKLASLHIKSKKVYKRRSTAVPITAASHAWSKSKKNGVIKFEISRDNELVENLIDDLQDVDAAKLEFLLKFIEQMLPISSIISSETEADTIISQEEKIPDKAIEMAEHIIETIYEKHAGNLDNFKETVLKLSFFKDKQSIAKNILKEILHEK
jgi:hypothetical protein